MATKKTTTAAKSPQNQNLLALTTYVFGFITGIIFLLLEKKNTFIRFHAAQSVITFGGGFVLGIIFQYLPFGRLLNTVLNLLEFILWIVLMVKAYKGIKFKLPYIGDLAEDLLKKIG